MSNTIQIEIAYAPSMEEQFLYTQTVEQGSTVGQALSQSTLLTRFPNLNTEHVGIFGRPTPSDTVLQAGDRIEVYRPLKIDPRDRRRQQVEEERKQDRKA
jgi:putative ubiquitin-RnfH superfamily antitoxin RatB of RatAB toxin-antitoxin module